jgi:hypothetical protein
LSGCVSGSCALSFFLGEREDDDFLSALRLAFFSGERDSGRLLVVRLAVGRAEAEDGRGSAESLAAGWARSGVVVLALGCEDELDGDGVVRPKTFGNIWYTLGSTDSCQTLSRNLPFFAHVKLALCASRGFWKLPSTRLHTPHS